MFLRVGDAQMSLGARIELFLRHTRVLIMMCAVRMLQSHYNAKYYLTCAAFPVGASYTLSGTCSGTITDGDTCSASCNSPLIRVAGASKPCCALWGGCNNWTDCVVQ